MNLIFLKLFKIKPKGVEREAYTGPVVDLTKEIELGMSDAKISPTAAANGAFHHRPMTKAGARNLQDSSFSLGGDQWDDMPVKSRAKNPPGGKSSVIF